MSNVVTFLTLCLLPGLIVLAFARRAVESNARTYPRVYGRYGKILALFGAYAGAIFWIVKGFVDLILTGQ
jgi:hypothetical protein